MRGLLLRWKLLRLALRWNLSKMRPLRVPLRLRAGLGRCIFYGVVELERHESEFAPINLSAVINGDGNGRRLRS